MKTLFVTGSDTANLKANHSKQRLTLFAMGLPFFLMILIFKYLPLLGWAYAFVDFKPGLKIYQCTFVGLKYFYIAFAEGGLLPVLRNTLVLSFLGLATSPIPVVLAILISEIWSKRFKKFIQTTTTLPHFISWVMVYAIFFSIFAVDDGLLNDILLRFHLISNPTNLLANSNIAWYFQTGLNLWKNLGWDAIIYIAAMSSIDPELYNSAKIDGAGRFKIIMNVTIPGIMPTYAVILILSVGYLLSNGFDQYYIFMNSLVADKLQVLDYYVYQMGIVQTQFSYATAIGVFKTFISIILIFIVNRIAKSEVTGKSFF